MSLGKYGEALKLFADLLKQNPSDVQLQCNQLIAACHADWPMAQSLAETLPPLEDVGIEALLEEGAVDAGEGTEIRSFISMDLDSIAKKKRNNRAAKRKRKRKELAAKTAHKGRLDHERWLPKWQRKKFRRRGGRRNAPEFRGAQGGTSKRNYQVRSAGDSGDRALRDKLGSMATRS